MNNDLEHVNLSIQAIEMEELQIEAYLRFLSKVVRLTKTTLVIYFHETRIVNATELSNKKSQLKP